MVLKKQDKAQLTHLQMIKTKTGDQKMKRASYILLFVAVAIAIVIILSPGASGVSSNPCSACHGSYRQYLDILESNSNNQIPTTITVGETRSVSIQIENDVNTQRYTTLSGVTVTLNSQNGHFSVATPTYNVGNLPSGTKTVTWQITGVSAGSDSLAITAIGTNTHQRRSFSDSYNPSPTITVIQSTPTPAPTASPSPNPTPTPAPTSEPTPTSKPDPLSPTSTPTPEPTQSPQNAEPTTTPALEQPAIESTISISLLSPSSDDVWLTGTENSISWKISGSNRPLIITIEYRTLDEEENWNQIAQGTNISSLTWITPDTPDIYHVRAVAIDSANPSQTASSVSSIEVRENLLTYELSRISPILITAIVLPAALVPGFLLPAISVWRANSKSKAKKRILSSH
jgi:hypothetical protein